MIEALNYFAAYLILPLFVLGLIAALVLSLLQDFNKRIGGPRQ